MTKKKATVNHLPKIDIKLALKDFGPITKGTVHLKPLTIFVGSNNSGKSYTAMLVHSLLSSGSESDFGGRSYLPKPVLRSASDPQQELEQIITNNKKNKSFSVPPHIAKSIFSRMMRYNREELHSILSTNFGVTEISDLIRYGAKGSRITASGTSQFSMLINSKLTVKNGPKPPMKYDIKGTSQDTEIGLATIEESSNGSVTIRVDERMPKKFLHFRILQSLLNHMYHKLVLGSVHMHSYYLPAARSGILQGHRALSASMVRATKLAGIEPLHIPQLTGVVSDFVSDIIMMPKTKGSFYKLAANMESEVLGGSIAYRPSSKDAFPEITFDSPSPLPLHRTSSTISEIAPISLYLKYVLKPGDLLIIEEPEAHLHPANQIILAKYIVKMIRQNLNVLITTHSTYILEQLGQFVIASKAKQRMHKNPVLDKNVYLEYDEVSPHLFKKDGNYGHMIELLETNDEDGIPQDEFTKVDLELHNRYVALQNRLLDA